MIYGVYFSPTSNTKKVVETMAKAIDDTAIITDVTVLIEFPLILKKDDFLIIGAPVYAGRIPGPAFERFLNIKGNKTPCVIVATYGNRHYDNALVEMANLLRKNGFNIHGAAAIIGRHTYGEIQIDRPNAEDLHQAIQFIEEVQKRNTPMKTQLIGECYQEPAQNHGRFHPLTNENCIKCGICAKNCPVQAISPDCSTISNQCISCFRCLRNCPLQAKHMKTEEYNSFAQMFTEKLKERKENEFFL